MNDLFNNKYRKNSTRILDRDYSFPGKYFVTICTDKRKMFFGKVENNKMQFNKIGFMADKFWIEIPKHFENVRLLDYIIMPNHAHGIIEILDDFELDATCRDLKDARSRVSTDIPAIDHNFRNKFGPLRKKSISSITQSYKASVKRWCNKNGFEYFSWQPRFYEHIIKSENSLENIIYYIRNNPLFWEKDKNNPINFK